MLRPFQNDPYISPKGSGYQAVSHMCRAQEELRAAPLYPHSAAYASEHGEMAQYNRSYQARGVFHSRFNSGKYRL